MSYIQKIINYELLKYKVNNFIQKKREHFIDFFSVLVFHFPLIFKKK